MAFEKYWVWDNIQAQLDGWINNTQTTLTVKNWTNPPANWVLKIMLTITKFNLDWTINKFEKALLTNKSGNNLTVTRGCNGTTATTFDNDDYIFLNITAIVIQDLQDEVTRLETAKENTANKWQANWYASLDSWWKVPSAQLPSYVDDIIEVANFSALPWTGETWKIYITLDTWSQYRWSWSAYIQINWYISWPEWFLINWQIVTSVSSWNLTVAIKTLAWTDSSTSDPVYCRIDWVVRSITSALSITLITWTNWNNMWSSELATKEVDNFVYLWYSTSENKVNMWFSRIPYWILISDFNNVSDTGEKSFARSWVFNLIDKVVNIWRFNAILSAWPWYTWSTPATSVIINRPIYETRLLDIAPVFVSSSWTVWSVTNSNLKYKINWNRVSLTYVLRLNKWTLTWWDVWIKVPFVPLIETPASWFICDITSTTPYTQLWLLVGGNWFIFWLKQSYTAWLPRTDISSDVNISTHWDYFI